MPKHPLTESHARALLAALRAPLELTKRGYFDDSRTQSFSVSLIATLQKRDLMAPQRRAVMTSHRCAWSTVELTAEGRQRALALLEILMRLAPRVSDQERRAA